MSQRVWHDWAAFFHFWQYGLLLAKWCLCFLIQCSFVIAFLSGSKCLLFSWLQLPFTVILEPKKIKSHNFHCFLIYLSWSDGTEWSLFLVCWVLSELFHSPFSPLSRGSLILLTFCFKGGIISLYLLYVKHCPYLEVTEKRWTGGNASWNQDCWEKCQ